MNVKDLISHLQTFHDETEVFIKSSDGIHDGVEGVYQTWDVDEIQRQSGVKIYRNDVIVICAFD